MDKDREVDFKAIIPITIRWECSPTKGYPSALRFLFVSREEHCAVSHLVLVELHVLVVSWSTSTVPLGQRKIYIYMPALLAKTRVQRS